MPDSYEAELDAWRARYLALKATRVWTPLPRIYDREPELPRVEYEAADAMPDYEGESQ